MRRVILTPLSILVLTYIRKLFSKCLFFHSLLLQLMSRAIYLPLNHNTTILTFHLVPGISIYTRVPPRVEKLAFLLTAVMWLGISN